MLTGIIMIILIIIIIIIIIIVIIKLIIIHLQTDWYDYSIRQKPYTEGNRKEKQGQRPRTRNIENVAEENWSDPCGCWWSWYSKEGVGRKHRESIKDILW